MNVATGTGKTLVLFDFDGTITRKDTLFAVIRFICGRTKFLFGMAVLFPCLCLYLLKLVANATMKEWVLRYFFGGMPDSFFRERCEAFTREALPSMIKADALAAIRKWQKEGADVVVVTASAEHWVSPWCRRQHIACIATRLQVTDGRVTGKIAGENCNGEEKVRRIEAALTLSSYEKIVAYGDTKNDWPMLRLAGEPHYKVFHQ